MGLFEGRSARSVGELPAMFSLNAVVCLAENLFIVGGERGEVLRGDPKLFDTEAAGFKAFRDGTDMKRVRIGTGFALDVSQPAPSTIYVVRIEWAPNTPEKGHLVRSRDGGVSWETVDGPPLDIIGVEFQTERIGYVWSTRVVHRTEDGGLSWSSVDVPGPLPRTAPRPVVDAQGALWMAAGHGPGWVAGRNVVFRVRPDLRIETEILDASFRVAAIDVTNDGVAWLLVDGPIGKRNRLMRLPAEKGTPELIAEFADGLTRHLRVLGRDIVILQSEPPKDTAGRYLMVSRDAGASWKKFPPPEHRVREVCVLGADDVWFIGTSGTVYAPR